MVTREPSKPEETSGEQKEAESTFAGSDSLPEIPLETILLDPRDRTLLVEKFSATLPQTPFSGNFDQERMANCAELLNHTCRSENPEQGELKFSVCVLFPDRDEPNVAPEPQIQVSPAHFDGLDRALLEVHAKLINIFTRRETIGEHLEYGPIEIRGIELGAVYELHLSRACS